MKWRCPGAYEVNGLETVGDLRRLLVIASLDTLGLENSIPRARTLGYLVGVARKLLGDRGVGGTPSCTGSGAWSENPAGVGVRR